MERSIAAKYATRPVPRFVRPSARLRESRLGLGGGATYRSGSTRGSHLGLHVGSALTHLRGGWRAFRAAGVRRTKSGRPRPVVAMRWAGSALASGVRRTSAATAPWRD